MQEESDVLADIITPCARAFHSSTGEAGWRASWQQDLPDYAGCWEEGALKGTGLLWSPLCFAASAFQPVSLKWALGDSVVANPSHT